MSKDIENKTSRLKYWSEILGLAIALITLVTLLINNCSREPSTNDPAKVDAPAKLDTIVITKEPVIDQPPVQRKKTSPGKTNHEVPVSSVQPSTHPVYDTIQLIMNARLSHLPIEVDGLPARIVKQTGTFAWILIEQKEENHAITIKDGNRLCGKSFYGTGNRIITLNLEDCK